MKIERMREAERRRREAVSLSSPQLNHLHGTKQSCWRVRDALGQDKQTVHII